MELLEKIINLDPLFQKDFRALSWFGIVDHTVVAGNAYLASLPLQGFTLNPCIPILSGFG